MLITDTCYLSCNYCLAEIAKPFFVMGFDIKDMDYNFFNLVFPLCKIQIISSSEDLA